MGQKQTIKNKQSKHSKERKANKNRNTGEAEPDPNNRYGKEPKEMLE